MPEPPPELGERPIQRGWSVEQVGLRPTLGPLTPRRHATYEHNGGRVHPRRDDSGGLGPSGRDGPRPTCRSLRVRRQGSRSTSSHGVLERVQSAQEPRRHSTSTTRSGVVISRLPPQSWSPCVIELGPCAREGSDVVVIERIDNVLLDPSKLRFAVSAKCRPLSVKLMSDTRPSPWSAPRWRCPASMRSWTNRDALVGLS